MTLIKPQAEHNCPSFKPCPGLSVTLTRSLLNDGLVGNRDSSGRNEPDGVQALPPGPLIAVDGTTFVIGAQQHTVGQNIGQGWAWIYTGTTADFSLSAPVLTVPLAGSASEAATAQSLYQFTGTVDLSVSVPPSIAGVTVNPTSTQVVLSAGSSAASNIQVSVAPYITPGTIPLRLTGTSGATLHRIPFRVKVVATVAGVMAVIDALAAQGCLDPKELNALTAAMTKIQNAVNAQNFANAEATLAALISQLKSPGNFSFPRSCRFGTKRFNPSIILTTDLEALGPALNLLRLH